MEDTNRVRQSLGLAPLPTSGLPSSSSTLPSRLDSDDTSGDSDPGSTLESRQEQGYDNWQSLQKSQVAKRRRAEQKEALKKARDTAQKFSKLAGKGLAGDDDADPESTRDWLRNQAKRQKKIAKQNDKKQRKELELKQRVGSSTHTAEDLEGVNVLHSLEDLDETHGAQIMTLKDATIDENEEEGDQLEILELKEKDALAERLSLKKKKAIYDPYAEDDEAEGAVTVLKQYDEVITGKKRKQFQLEQGVSNEHREVMKQAVGERPKRQAISLEITKLGLPASDYRDPVERKFKNPKKKRAKIRPEDVARQLREEGPALEDHVEEGGIVMDETSEFVANLQRAKEEGISKAHSLTPVPKVAADDDTDMKDANDINTSLLSAQHRSAPPPPSNSSLSETGLSSDATLSTGIGSTLSMLTQRGLIAGQDSSDIVSLHRDRERFRTEKQRREAEIEAKARLQRERDRQSGRLNQMSAREREDDARAQNKQRETMESRVMTDIFNREYKPDVQLRYVDEHGRNMAPKEAFKQLSHQFHGKGSGKMKMEKHLKKIEDEGKVMAQSSLDSSQAVGMERAAGGRKEKLRVAGVRLA